MRGKRPEDALPSVTRLATLAKTKDDYFFAVPIVTAARFNNWRFLSAAEGRIRSQPPPGLNPELPFTCAIQYRPGNFAVAAAVFGKDLEINRGNGRSRFGLIESLHAQGKPVPERLTLQYREAWKNATMKLSLETM